MFTCLKFKKLFNENKSDFFFGLLFPNVDIFRDLYRHIHKKCGEVHLYSFSFPLFSHNKFDAY